MSYEVRTHARDGAPPSASPFSWPTRALVHSVALAAADGWLVDAQVLAAARLVAEDAHRRELLVQHVLVALKREWAGMPDARRLDSTLGRDVFDLLVTACIKAYYELPGADPGARAGEPPRDGATAGPAPADVAVTLLHVIQTVEPPAPADDAEARDPAVTARLTRALASVSADEAAALISTLRGLLVALRRQHRAPPRGRLTPGARLHPPAP